MLRKTKVGKKWENGLLKRFNIFEKVRFIVYLKEKLVRPKGFDAMLNALRVLVDAMLILLGQSPKHCIAMFFFGSDPHGFKSIFVAKKQRGSTS